jgi:hypothetical protein
MANPEHLAILKKGVEAWNHWRKKNPKVTPGLVYADLVEADLNEANLSFTDLRNACLIGAKLRGANLNGASLGEVDLRAATLYRANLSRTYFGLANLRLTDLARADLTGADLNGANLTLARVGFTTFCNVNLSGVKGLDTLKHIGPSSIDIDTIYKSKSPIQQAFLRGAGVPEKFIEFVASMAFTGIEFYSLFISYSTKDKEFADQLHTHLQAKGVRCWKDDHDMRGGKKVHEQIERAIQAQDKLLLILSSASMASEWVKSEIAKARKREVEGKRQILFPIRLCDIETIKKWEYFDSDIGKDSAREIREYHIPDFSNWKDNDSYQLAFDKLLRDLQGDPKPDSA